MYYEMAHSCAVASARSTDDAHANAERPSDGHILFSGQHAKRKRAQTVARRESEMQIVGGKSRQTIFDLAFRLFDLAFCAAFYPTHWRACF